MLLLILVHIRIDNCYSELSGRARLVVSARSRASHIVERNDFLLTSDILHFTYYFQHVTVAQNDTVYIVAIRVLDELANHSRTLSSHSGNRLSLLFVFFLQSVFALRPDVITIY